MHLLRAILAVAPNQNFCHQYYVIKHALMVKRPIPHIKPQLFRPLSQLTQLKGQYTSSLPSWTSEAACDSNTIPVPHKAHAAHPKACQILQKLPQTLQLSDTTCRTQMVGLTYGSGTVYTCVRSSASSSRSFTQRKPEKRQPEHWLNDISFSVSLTTHRKRGCSSNTS